ncbi:glycosyltransferase family 2 protein [Patescibacteria group bacterium]|nr:glycosyltransferase family 2 protein [Patescibacteria group bacterium]
MLKNKSIGVVVPAYNEEKLIEKTLATIPNFVDKIIVVNDFSKDKTKNIIEGYKNQDKRIILINHKKNQGLGQSLIDGYLKSIELKIDIIAIMAGDAQMDPDDLHKIIEPIIKKNIGYVKGNRLLTHNISKIMPMHRLIGNSFLTLLTKFATGYWSLIDPQCGYTAISLQALESINIKKMTKGYGYNADILNMLNLANIKVQDVEVKPIYGEEKSKIKLITYIPKVSYLLLILYLRRMTHKYLVREFHPLIFFYLFSFINIFLISMPLMIRFFYLFFKLNEAPKTTLIILCFSIMMGFFSFFFGMWLDMEDNKKLTKK